MKQILFNGKIYLNRGSFASALLIEDGIIRSTGTDQAILSLQTPDTKKMNLQGKTVLPGFNDSHLHFYGTAVAHQTVDLYGSTSLLDIKERSVSFLNQHPLLKGQTLFGRGWNQDYFTDEIRLINRFDLDQISTEYPIVFARACGHVVSVNSKALEVLNINKHTPQIEGGHFDVDDLSQPTGIFRENAILLLNPLQKSLSIENRIGLLKTISALANRYGITSVQTNDLTLGTIESKDLEAAYHYLSTHEPTLRITHQLCFKDLEAFQNRIHKGYHLNENTFYRYGPLKLFVDGSLGARTANMRKPYTDDPSTSGIECMSSESLEAYVSTANKAGIQVAIHAIGDEAMTQVLNAYQKVIDTKNPLRHGIIHCQITDKELLQRFQDMDILAYVQPIFLHYDHHIVESRVGKQLASSSYAFKSMEDLKLHVAYGTDSPVEGLNVFHNIHCALHRQDLNDLPINGFYPQEKVDLETAIDNYTSGGAYTSFEENTKGRLTPGYVADLVVLDQPVFSMDLSQIKKVQVDMTMVNGAIVYTRQ